MSGLVYELNEKVMCHSLNDVFAYPAKVVEVDERTAGERRYQIHYIGWNANTDIWVEHDDVAEWLMKHTPEIEAEEKRRLNEYMTELKQMALKKKEKIAATPKKGNGNIQDPTVVIPPKLRELINEDREMIEVRNRLTTLPALYTIDDIVKDYQDELNAKGRYVTLSDDNHNRVKLNKQNLVKSSQAIVHYFNILLGPELLYANEHEQYTKSCIESCVLAGWSKVTSEDREENQELDKALKILPSSIYGIGHLVRLFTRIGSFITWSKCGGRHTTIIQHFHHFLAFLSIKADTYHDTGRDYQAVAGHREIKKEYGSP